MSIRLLSLVLDRVPLQGGALLTLIALADWADDDGVCWPSVPKLAAKARQSERNVRYVLHDLQAAGYVRVCILGWPKAASISPGNPLWKCFSNAAG